MSLISAALADGGFEIYTIDLPGHGDSREPFRADLAQQAILNARNYLGDNVIVLGHSMGASMLLDLAVANHFSTMVLLSPPPLSISEIHADRILIATGALDIPRIRAFVPIVTDIGGPNAESWILPWSGHSGPVLNPAYIRKVVEWLGGDGKSTKTAARLFWFVVMFSSTVGFAALNSPPFQGGESSTSIPGVFVRYITAASVALVVLKFLNPLVWLRLFATDYVIGFLLVAGVILLATDQGTRVPTPRFLPLLKAVLAAAYVILVPGLVVTSSMFHMTLSDGRWWRFFCIVLAGLPFFLADELTTRRITSRWKSIAVAIVTRGLLLALLLTGVLILNRENGFLVMIVPLIAIFWIALWFASGLVYGRTRDPLAAALFSAIVQGWAFAAWFVTI
jgi:pimeloyl-ACP methyl ester carboxylesterase